MILSQLALVSAVLIAAQQPVPTAPAGSGEISKEQADTLISECGERRFEASADVPRDDGKVRRTKITLCAADSDTNAEWISKLEKAAAQIEAHPTFPDTTKKQLFDELRAEIARVKSGQTALDQGQTSALEAALVAIPVLTEPETPLPAPHRRPERSPLADFNALPPLPRAPAPGSASAPAATGTTAIAAAPRAMAPARRGPQLTVRCVRLGDYRDQPCGIIMPDERLIFRATEAFDGPVTLRFTRTDSGTTAEVPFATRALRAGQSGRVGIPKEICAARFRARFDIHAVTTVINGGRAGERVGSFEARCELG